MEARYANPEGTDVALTIDGATYAAKPDDPRLEGVEIALYEAADLRREVPKILVVERLGAAGKLRDARAALKLGRPDDDLTDAELMLRDRWEAASVLYSDDEDVIGLLLAVGADPAVILAA